ncbi:MAG: hypothetical protein JO086_04630 [Acidimicrobiia bacterium]|nr:hypothetical protein [Acidimicrobiia bacterium]
MSGRRTATALAGLLAVGSLATGVAANARSRPAPASLDGSFGSHGVASLGSGYQLFGAAAQRDGKIVVVGEQISHGAVRLALARLDTHGRLDHGFNHGHVVLGPGVSTGGSIGRGVAIQKDGKIVVVGILSDRSGTGQDGMLVERFSSGGGLDHGFASHGIASLLTSGAGVAAGSAVAIQSDGKIVVAGGGAGADGLQHVAVVRLDSHGRLDHHFGSGGVRIADGAQDLGRNGIAYGVGVQSGGRVVVAGSVTPNFQTPNAFVARFSSGGNLDRGFGSGGSYQVFANVKGGAAAVFQALAVAPDGSLAVGGYAASGGANSAYALVARLTGSGHPIGSFGGGLVSIVSHPGPGLPSPIPGVGGIAFGRGGVVATGGSSAGNGFAYPALWSLDSHGHLIGSGTTVTKLSSKLGGGQANAVTIDPSGRIVIAGAANNFFSYNAFVIRYHGFG